MQPVAPVNSNHKIRSREQLATELSQRRGQQQGSPLRVGFTSGTFDLLHPGHVDYLERARALCDCLVVGVNSDSSVRSYKDPTRPVMSQEARLRVVAGLACVDYAFLFDELNNNVSITVLRPELYIKASDYSQEQLSSKPLVEAYGGRVELLPLLKGYSSTAIIEQIQQQGNCSTSLPHAAPVPAPAVFLDRDGTLIEHVEYLSEPEKVRILPGVLEGLVKLRANGFRLVMITNQPGIGMGYFTREDFFRVNRVLLKAASKVGVVFDKIYFCPHSPVEGCSCHKPRTALVERARDELALDLSRSVVIGDTTLDMALAQALGMKGILVQTGVAGQDATYTTQPEYSAVDFSAATDWVLTHYKPEKPLSAMPEPTSSSETQAQMTLLEAVGQLGAKVGHDFNNLLGSMRGCVDLIASKMKKLHPEASPVARQIELLNRSIDQAVQLTTKLRGFVRPGELSLAPGLLSTCIEDACRSIRDTLPASVEIEVRTDANPKVLLNSFYITQMVASIVMNSVEVLKKFEQGYVLLWLSEAQIGSEQLHGTELQGAVPDGRYARLCILDHGPGLTAQGKQQLFQPFASTQKASIGRGFGLTFSMAREIMKKHRGHLALESVAGCGTLVQLYFPIIAEAA
jgi:rfaE bifunctional protein nucleotidyltransferase chain/domain